MKRWLECLTFAGLMPCILMANSDFDAGSEFAGDIKDQGSSAIAGLNPNDSLPNYTANPVEKKFYSGVTSPSNNMDDVGNRALQQSEVGKAITDSILNNPKESISIDAPFISAGFDQQRDAEQVADGSFNGCRPSVRRETVISHHLCERDVNVIQTCLRKASISGHWEDSTRYQNIKIVGQSLPFAMDSATNTFSAKVSIPKGTVVGADFNYSWNKRLAFGNPAWVIVVNTLESSVIMQDEVGTGRFPVGKHFEANSFLTIWMDTVKANGAVQAQFLWPLENMRYEWTLTLTLVVPDKKWVPEVSWSEPCPLSREHGVEPIGSVCSVAGGVKDVVVGGVSYRVHSDCWQYTDTYRTQAADEGSCGPYTNSSQCTLATRLCTFRDQNLCLHEDVTYSCEKVISAQGIICGGQFFCSDGSCAQTATGKNNAFQHAVAQLAAMAAAGDDVAALNNVDVRAFSGRGLACRKATAGFNDCCKSSGWGSDAGLANCNSDEKALGQARERKLTVEVGEYCDKKVLGVCVQKKRGFCQFDSKLAQIIQQQGRSWQLGVGFGSAKSPDCRGVTVPELQRIQFDTLDFKSFYEDLESGTDIPADNALIEKARQEIQRRMHEAGR